MLRLITLINLIFINRVIRKTKLYYVSKILFDFNEDYVENQQGPVTYVKGDVHSQSQSFKHGIVLIIFDI